MEPSSIGLVPLYKEEETPESSVSARTGKGPGEDTVRGQPSTSQVEVSPESNSDGT